MENNILADKYFIWKDKEGLIQGRGKVIGHVANGFHLIQFYDLNSGMPTTKRIYGMELMKYWNFFDTVGEMEGGNK